MASMKLLLLSLVCFSMLIMDEALATSPTCYQPPPKKHKPHKPPSTKPPPSIVPIKPPTSKPPKPPPVTKPPTTLPPKPPTTKPPTTLPPKPPTTKPPTTEPPTLPPTTKPPHGHTPKPPSLKPPSGPAPTPSVPTPLPPSTTPTPSVPTPTPPTTTPTPPTTTPTPTVPTTPPTPILTPPTSTPPKGFYPSPPATCSIDIIKLGVCVPILGGILGNPLQSDCCALLGIIGLDVEVCLCAAINANVLGIININVSKLDVIVNILTTCGRKVPPNLTCP